MIRNDANANIVEEIISIPVSFTNSNKSPADLLVASGYLESPEAITVDILADALRKSPEYIESWLIWSDDKRTDSGWYFQRKSGEDFLVGYYPARPDLPTTRYSDAYLAGANFVKLEIEEIRKAIT